MKGLSVIIPVKPPEPYLSRLLDQVYHFLVLANIPHETLIQTEPGLTNAVIKGVQHASYDTVVVMDADGSHEPSDLPIMYKLFDLDYFIKRYDFVVSYKARDETSFKRKIISKFYRGFAKILLNLNIKDPMSGFVMGKKQLFLTLKPSSDYKFLLQLFMNNPELRGLNYPITFKRRKEGMSKASLRTGIKTFTSILGYWWNQ